MSSASILSLLGVIETVAPVVSISITIEYAITSIELYPMHFEIWQIMVANAANKIINKILDYEEKMLINNLCALRPNMVII